MLKDIHITLKIKKISYIREEKLTKKTEHFILDCENCFIEIYNNFLDSPRMIELEEIEAHLNQFNGIKRSVVRALETSKTNKVLEAFYSSDNAINAKDITDYLSTKLPEYMIPVVFRRVKDFIETTNGKIDRKRLSDCLVLENSLTNNSATILSGK